MAKIIKEWPNEIFEKPESPNPGKSEKRGKPEKLS